MDYLLVIFIGLLLGTLIYEAFFSKRAEVRRKLRNATKKNIGEFKDGDLGKIAGKVVLAGDFLIAPVTKRKCAWYHLVVRSSGSGSDNGGSHKIINEEKRGDLILFDGTHYAWIEMRNTKSDLVPDANAHSGRFDTASPELESLLNRHQHESTDMFGFSKRIDYTEAVLEENETVTAIGEGKWVEVPKRFNLQATRMLLLHMAENIPVYVSDDPRTTRS